MVPIRARKFCSAGEQCIARPWSTASCVQFDPLDLLVVLLGGCAHRPVGTVVVE
jgi:hypothetical protein